MYLYLTYDIESGVILVNSPLSACQHVFSPEGLDDFIDWLGGVRHSREPWHAYEVFYRFVDETFVVVFRDWHGNLLPFLAFGEGSFADEVRALESGIARLKDRLIVPVQGMRDSGMDSAGIAQALDRRNLFDLPVVWSR